MVGEWRKEWSGGLEEGRGGEVGGRFKYLEWIFKRQIQILDGLING